MQFLDYTGHNKKINSILYKFEFKGDIEIESAPLFIVPPIYDVSFKKVFACNNTGLKLLKDFLNSILFPKSKLITEIKFLQKEIHTNSNLNHEQETLIFDDVFIAKIKYSVEGKTKEKEVLIDVIMESNYRVVTYTNEIFNDTTENRNQNDFQETWVIALSVNRSKNPREINSNQSNMNKKYSINDINKDLDYIRIIEIYLNDYYSKLDEKISIFEGEEIDDIGKEWIKLFTIELWSGKVNDSSYCLPVNIEFKGDEIKKAVQKLSDILELVELRIKVEKKFQEETEENFQKQLYEIDYEKGYLECAFKVLDIYFQKYINGETLQSIILAEKVKYSDLEQKYGKSSKFKGFIEILKAQNWIID